MNVLRAIGTLAGTMVVGWAAASPPAAALGFGPFDLGQSLAEVQAATPQANWRTHSKSPHTGRIFIVESQAAVSIDGIGFDVQALVHYYQRGLNLRANLAAKDAPACEAVALKWLTQVEARTGPLQSRAPRAVPGMPGGLQWHVQRGATGITGVTPSMAPGTPDRTEGEVLKFGTASTALVEAFDDLYRSRPRQQWFSGPLRHFELQSFQRGPRHAVEARVQYEANAALNCSLNLQLKSWTTPPPPEVFDATKAKLREEPTQAVRHLLLSQQREPLTDPVDVVLDCGLMRATGWPTNCQARKREGQTWVHGQQARQLAERTVYDLGDADRDDPQDMRTTLTVRLAPGDVKALDFVNEARTPTEAVVFEQAATPAELARQYPFGVNAAAGAVEATVVCQVQSDGSLICAGTEVTPDAHQRAFAPVARRVAGTLYKAAPALRDGSPSTGRVIELKLRFAPEP